MKVLFIISSCVISVVVGAAWDFTNSAVSTVPLKQKLLVSSCSTDARAQIKSAFKATNLEDVVDEPSRNNFNRIRCTSDPAIQLTIDRDLDDDAETDKPDRQRLEIKTKLENLGGPVAKQGSTYVYAWWFKLNENIKLSTTVGHFFHIFQIKSNEKDTDPLVALSLRTSGSEKNISLRFFSELTQKATYYDLGSVSQVAGIWTEVYVKVYYHSTNGSVDITLKNSKGLNASKPLTKVPTFWNSSSFYRAKWGLYRSISSSYNKNDTIALQNVQIRGSP